MVDLLMTCPFCGTEHYVTVPESCYHRWIEGELVQDAFPMLSVTEREQLISHLCPACQVEVFGE